MLTEHEKWAFKANNDYRELNGEKPWTEEEFLEHVRRNEQWRQEYDRKLARRKARLKPVKMILFTPVIFLLRILEFAAHLLKYPAALAALYGFWCVYKVVMEIKGGSPFFQATHLRDACIFVAAPFVMCGLEVLFLHLGVEVQYHRDR